MFWLGLVIGFIVGAVSGALLMGVVATGAIADLREREFQSTASPK
jgi:hypothetical protein